MNNLKIKLQQRKIEELFQDIDQRISNRTLREDDVLVAEIGRHLCVRISGFLENAVRILYIEYVRRRRPSPAILRFIELEIDGFQNADMAKIIKLANQFSIDWANDLMLFTEGQIRSSVNSVVSNRHIIAHGRDN